MPENLIIDDLLAERASSSGHRHGGRADGAAWAKEWVMRLRDIDFVIIGAAKSATTWLQRSLQADPAVAMPDPELHYFSRHYDRGDEWYLSQFPAGAAERVAGEKSNSYLDDPQAPARLSKAVPQARLIAQLRNPVDRAYSDYCMLYRRGEVGSSIGSYLDPRLASEGRFLVGGLYYQQLLRYLDLYEKDQILIVLHEDMVVSPEDQLRQVREFLGLPTESMPMVRARVKDKTTPTVRPGAKRMLRALKPLVAPLRGTSVFEMIRSPLVGTPNYPPLSEDLKKRLADFYSAETEGLSRLMGRDLGHWVAPPGDSAGRDRSARNVLS